MSRRVGGEKGQAVLWGWAHWGLDREPEHRPAQGSSSLGKLLMPTPAPQMNHSTAISEVSFISSYKNLDHVLSIHLQKQYYQNYINNIKHANSTNVQRLLCTIDVGQFLAKYLERGPADPGSP